MSASLFDWVPETMERFGFLAESRLKFQRRKWTHQYVVPHLPDHSAGWTTEMHLYNPTAKTISAHITVHGREQNTYYIQKERMLSIEPKQMVGLNDMLTAWKSAAWIRIEASGRLGGSCSFAPIFSPGQKTCVPLSPLIDKPTHQLFPHLPGDRGRFWSGLTLVNVHDTPVDVHFTLWNDRNQDISPLLEPPYQSAYRLAPWQKLFARFEGELFRACDNADKVAWVEVECSSVLVGLKLFGKQQCDQDLDGRYPHFSHHEDNTLAMAL